MATLPIETERLRIHHLAADDWHAVDAYTIDPGEMTKEQTNQFIAGSMADEAQAYAVDHRAEERLIGHIGFHPWFDSLIFEIGWVFHPRYHG